MKLSEKIQEALREQQEINLSDPAVQKRLAAQWGYVPAGAQPASGDWPMLCDGHLRALCFAYEKGFAAGIDERNTENVFGESGSQAAAFDVGLDCGRSARNRAQPAPIEMSVTTGALSEMFLSLDGHDKAQPGYEWRKGWNDAIRQAMDYAQPAPSVPEDVMRDAERYRYLRARDDETAGVGCWIEANGRVCDRGWLYGVQLDSAIDSCIEVLAAAPKPEAKP